MNQNILTVENLSKTFDGLRAVDDFSFVVAKGRIVSLIGPNGAGKTTVFNIITGFLAADGGEVFYQGKQTNGLPAYQIAQRGMARTFQDLRLIKSLPVIENIILARPQQSGEHFLSAVMRRKKLLHEEARNRQKALELLEFVGLADKQNNLAGALSYGQQKLLTLACCLAMEADLLLLDEPVSGVHPDMIAKMLSLITQLAAAGKTILFIEHNIEAVMQVADHVVVMDAGRKIAEGPPQMIKDNPEILEAYLE
ncbi:MAG: ABC transporter ATP-binding protein [candidate division KSB1 bacterium]|nr:ABC transporter ATP-binding protein [candidate division KSB1 bacterium]MDZ7369456.1 ABC transporter ATP-binding protein [candidate division KSB1 bacterium]MDZ7407563.1 ABC transporter ATP-binding protein [candidate division KSB1 bacterium]